MFKFSQNIKRATHSGWLSWSVNIGERVYCSLRAAWAAATRAMGTRNGEHDT
jgi:hypothetical protein